MLQDLKTEIADLVSPIVAREGYEVVEIKLSRYKNRYRLQVFLDSDHGISLDECARMSGLIGTALDVADPIDSQYLLEVSSPGLDRSLKSERDFRRCLGSEVTVEYADDLGHTRTTRGQVQDVTAEVVSVAGKNGTLQVYLDRIRRVKLVI